jgi:glycosyltransferase involved in cell wall biosynthesis
MHATATASPVKVLVIAPHEKLPSFQIGIRQPFEALSKLGLIDYKVMEEENSAGQTFIDSQVIVFIRNTNKEAYALLQEANRLNKRTIYSIDDHFLHLPNRGYGITMTDPERRETFARFLTEAQTVRVGSPYFAKHIQENYNKSTVCIQASVDFAWLEKAGVPTRSKQTLVIGYEGSYKEDDFEQVIPALLTIMEEYKHRIRLEFHGYVPSELIGHPGIVFFTGSSDYRTFMHILARRAWDIGIAPLQDSLYNRCKSNNKFREYSACRIPGIYSNLPTYADCVSHEQTGILTGHRTDDWYRAIKRLVEDEQLRTHIRRKAYRYVQEHFTIERCAAQWERLLTDKPTQVGLGGIRGEEIEAGSGLRAT